MKEKDVIKKMFEDIFGEEFSEESNLEFGFYIKRIPKKSITKIIIDEGIWKEESGISE